LADIVEATMGAAYLAGGVELGLKSAIALQIPFDHMTEWKHFNETYTESRAQLKARVKEASKRHLKLDHLEEITGYRFRNPLLVIEALTHASEPNSTVPCYQRLEFLGDGILDFLVVNYLFHKYPDYEPGRMTDIKDGCVNNRVLGAMCLEMGLNKHIIHFSSKLMGAITQFAREVELIKDSGEDIGEYWSDLDVPKVLSDVVESVLGAIFVDSGFDFDTVQKSFNFFMIPFFDKYVQPDILKVHPLKTLTTGLQKIHCDGLLLR
jgi:endoribonuclease Dicer